MHLSQAVCGACTPTHPAAPSKLYKGKRPILAPLKAVNESQDSPCSQLYCTRRDVLTTLSVGALTPAPGPAAAHIIQDSDGKESELPRWEDNVSEFTLPNGLHFLVMERHAAPVVSCHTYANIGAYDEKDGQTGIAHLLEHMAFKGTERIGTLDFQREAPVLDALDEVFYSLQAAQKAGASKEIRQLNEQFKKLQAVAEQMTVPNAFGALLQQEGAVGLNATTSQDQTRYFMSLPSNKLELWFALESERFQQPVFRELYSEKQVVAEERSLRIDNSPMGKFQYDFALAALGNNYRRPVIGFAEDVARMGRREVQQFFDQYYGPGNLTMAVVGDVKADRVYQLANKYFGSWQPSPTFIQLPRGSRALPKEPLPLPSGDEREFRQAAKAGPGAMLAFYRPPVKYEDGVALEALADIMSGGRSSRLTSSLVLSQKALSASVSSGYPGEKHAGLMLVYGIPRQGDSVEQMGSLLRGELDRLVEEGVSNRELMRVKKNSQRALLGTIQSNTFMASALCSYHVATGSWRGLLEEIELVQDLSKQEVQAMAERVFDRSNCFTGYIMPLSA